MAPLDYWIIGGYLVALLALGAFLARRAAEDSGAYFLGGRRLPWWALGSSGMSSNFDVAGTMTLVTLVYYFGFQALWIETRGGVVLPIAVFLAFMGKWHRRSEVMTTAEWMELRFGTGWQGRAARLTAAATYIAISVGMVTFFLGAAGKFLAVFLPFDERTCQVLMLGVALVYTMMSGLYGVVLTDVFQSVLIGGAAVYVAVAGASVLDPALVAAWPGGGQLRIVPPWYDEAFVAPLGGGLDYRMFGVLLLAWAGKGLLEGLGGSGGSAYMAQRFYSARNERDCLRIGMLWTVLFAFRWPMVLGFVLLAVHLGAGIDDPETILPAVLSSEFFPAGIRGVVVAAMLAAAMSTFDSTINAGASYVVRDIWPLARPRAGERELVLAAYAASAGIVGAGLALAWNVSSVLDVWLAIVINLFPAFLAPFALRWFWGRLNGAGFTLGVASGFAAAMGVSFFGGGTGWNEAMQMGVIAGISALGCVVGAFLFARTDEDVRKEFYMRIRPSGLWPGEWKRADRAEHAADWLRLVVALMWQMASFFLPLCLMTGRHDAALALGAVWTVCGAVLWREAFGGERRGQMPSPPPTGIDGAGPSGQ